MMISHSMHRHASAFAGRKQQPAAGTGMRHKCVVASSRMSFGSDDNLCPVSYSTDRLPSGWHRAMPTAARLAFKALERDTTVAMARSRVHTATAAASTAPQSAIDTLCLVTYSDDEAPPASWHKQQLQQQPSRLPSVFTGSLAAAAAAATAPAHPRTAAAVFAALSSEDQTEEGGDGLPGVMETLCMLSYDEESA